MFELLLRQIVGLLSLATIIGIATAPNCLAQAVSVTITSNYTGRAFTVSGAGCAPGGYTTPQTLQWSPGSSCSVSFLSPHSVQLGTQYVFNSWQDGSAANPRVIATPVQDTTYTASFTQQFSVMTQANPAEGGTISGGGWVNYGSSVTLTATPASSYRFVDWSGLPNGPSGANPATTAVYGPITAIADFAPLTNALPSNYTLTQVTSWGTSAGINIFGQVAGRDYSSSRPFLWTPSTANGVIGSLTDLGGLPMGTSPQNFATGINDRGQVAGWTYYGNQTQVFLWSPSAANGTAGTIVSLSGPDLSTYQPSPTINSFGQVGGVFGGNWGIWTPSAPNGSTGAFTNNSQFQGLVKMNGFGQAIMSQNYSVQAVLFTPSAANGSTGTFTSIAGLAGSTRDVLQGINDNGTVVGYSCVAQPSGCQNHGFIWTPTTGHSTTGTIAEIPIPTGSISLTPMALNNQGDIVGTMVQSGGSTVPFLYTGGKIYDLSWISSVLIGGSPSGINQAGQIVFNSNNSTVYIASPTVQLPSSVTITITSAPAGLSFTSEGSSYTTPYAFQWTPGTTHTVSFPLVILGAKLREGFAGWSDGDKNATRNILVPNSPSTFTANYVPQYELSSKATPDVGGIVTASPASPDGFYNANTTVQITAIANSAYQFTKFSGDLTGTAPSQPLVMSNDRTVHAHFSQVKNPALSMQIVNDVSKRGQAGPNVTAAVRLTNSGDGVAGDIQLTDISARILAPAPGPAVVNKATPVSIGDLPPGATSGTIYVPVVLPDAAKRVVLLINGTVRNSAGRLFTFNTSMTMIR